MAPAFELNPVDSIVVGTVGPPGQRRFFLRATGGADTVVLGCEKVHVQGLIERIADLLPGDSGDAPAASLPAAATEPAAADVDPAWGIGELGLGGPDERGLFVLVAREMPSEGTEDPEQLSTARLWVRAEQLRDFSRQAATVVAAGRPPCPHCGLPVDPSGHPCPVANGSRPVV
ncbi:MAG: DUF3090 domain-containing protein [Candidatus Dormibacteraeota bacterium]|nr:DUF3090 domain-containing protein [Candidatus Dormibacteraeota bacterium]